MYTFDVYTKTFYMPCAFIEERRMPVYIRLRDVYAYSYSFPDETCRSADCTAFVLRYVAFDRRPGPWTGPCSPSAFLPYARPTPTDRLKLKRPCFIVAFGNSKSTKAQRLRKTSDGVGDCMSGRWTFTCMGRSGE